MPDKIVTPADLDRLKALVTSAVSGWAAGLPAAPTTPPPPPVVDYTPKLLNADVTTYPGKAVLSWTDGPSGGPVSYTYARNGTDTNGAGPWTSNPFGTSTTGKYSVVLDKLKPATGYTFTVTARTAIPNRTWIASVNVMTPGTVPPVVTPPAGTGAVTWSSGVWTNQDAAAALAFERQRGQALGNIVVFTERNTWGDQLSGRWRAGLPSGFTGDLVIKIPLWTMDGDSGNSGDWASLALQIADVDPNAWVCLGWEANLPSWYYQLRPDNVTTWIGRYRTAVMTMRKQAPGLRFAWNPNAGPDQTGVDSRAVFQQLKDLHTGYGPDSYDAYPADTSTAAWATHLNARGFLGESYEYATANGMQFVLPEWGVASGSQWGNFKGYDNPRYINDYLGFLKAVQHKTVTLAINGKVVPAIGFESYFSEPNEYLRSDWASNPKAAAAYAAQFTA